MINPPDPPVVDDAEAAEQTPSPQRSFYVEIRDGNIQYFLRDSEKVVLWPEFESLEDMNIDQQLRLTLENFQIVGMVVDVALDTYGDHFTRFLFSDIKLNTAYKFCIAYINDILDNSNPTILEKAKDGMVEFSNGFVRGHYEEVNTERRLFKRLLHITVNNSRRIYNFYLKDEPAFLRIEGTVITNRLIQRAVEDFSIFYNFLFFLKNALVEWFGVDSVADIRMPDRYNTSVIDELNLYKEALNDT